VIKFFNLFLMHSWLLLIDQKMLLASEPNLHEAFKDRDACLLVENLTTGSTILEFNPSRCKIQVPPQSTFKFPAAIMAFEAGIIQSSDQIIKWNGVKNTRATDNKDQTPKSWMSNSSVWVTRWLMPQLGTSAIDKFLTKFRYGNRDFSGGIEKAWISSTLKISGYEQLEFMKQFLREELGISKKGRQMAMEVLFYRESPNGAKLYGKTGTGCLRGKSCMKQPERMLGWFVGFVVNGDATYVFAANADDKIPVKEAAGPRIRKTVIELLEQVKLF